MITIEIHGLSPARSIEVRKHIFGLFVRDDLQVTVVHNTTTDYKGSRQTFLRVFIDGDTNPSIERMLESTHMRIEIVPTKFVPAKPAHP